MDERAGVPAQIIGKHPRGNRRTNFNGSIRIANRRKQVRTNFSPYRPVTGIGCDADNLIGDRLPAARGCQSPANDAFARQIFSREGFIDDDGDGIERVGDLGDEFTAVQDTISMVRKNPDDTASRRVEPTLVQGRPRCCDPQPLKRAHPETLALSTPGSDCTRSSNRRPTTGLSRFKALSRFDCQKGHPLGRESKIN